MLRTLTWIGLIVAVWLPLMDVAVFRKKRRALGDVPRWRGLEMLAYFVFVVTTLLLAVSSFGMILIGSHMHRWMLIVHMSVAPAFAVAITLLAYLWVEQATFAPRDEDDRFYPGEKVAFWVIVASAFGSILSAMLGMMTWFGSAGQTNLLRVHNGSSLVLLVATIYLACRLWLGRAASTSAA